MPKQSENDGSVKLKPIMGIRPGVYLSVLYSFILLILLFFLLIFPGLVNGGAILAVKTEPMGAAVRINDVYMGKSGNGIFLPKGSYTVEAVLPGFEKAAVVQEIPRRVFGSLFFPLRRTIELTLTSVDPAGAFALEAADFAAWSFGPEPTASWQIPLSLSEGAYRNGPASNEAMFEILAASSRFAVTRAALRDLIRAKILLDSRGLSPSPAGLIGSVSDILVFLSENPGSGRLLAELLPMESAGLIKSSAWHKDYYATDNTGSFLSNDVSLPARMELAGLTFLNIKNFMIGESPVPRSLFESFVGQNPQWREAQTDYFPEQISVYPADTFTEETITGVTWFAAQAFCAWLTERLPSSMAGMEIRLPTEAEWEEYANITGIESRGWEWCADPYAPLLIFPASRQAIEAVGSPERSLRRFSISETRASLPPELSSPFVSFRPVIAKRDNKNL